MADCKNRPRNMKYCNCSFPCGKKGVCCECISYHRAIGELPACYFPADAERSGDRSIGNFISIVQKEGIGYLR